MEGGKYKPHVCLPSLNQQTFARLKAEHRHWDLQGILLCIQNSIVDNNFYQESPSWNTSRYNVLHISHLKKGHT